MNTLSDEEVNRVQIAEYRLNSRSFHYVLAK